jgi:hypothetical protein
VHVFYNSCNVLRTHEKDSIQGSIEECGEELEVEVGEQRVMMKNYIVFIGDDVEINRKTIVEGGARVKR